MMLLDIEELKKQLDDADRRAGRAERMLSHEHESRSNRNKCIADRKGEWGFSDQDSFDVVWDHVSKLATLASENLEWYSCQKCLNYEVKGYKCSNCGHDRTSIS